MNLGETATLIVRLRLKDELSKGIGGITSKLKGLDGSVRGGLGKIGKGLGEGFRNSMKLAAGVVGFLAGNIAVGINSLADLEDAMNQTKAVIKSTGGVAGLTAEDIRELSERMEELTTVDDKLVQSGANLLLTFKNVRKNAFEPAIEAALDMSEAMDMELEPAILAIGKALQDPIAGIGRLGRMGVQFSEEQEALIKTLVESNDLFGAQTVILDELESQFGGSAVAAQEGYRGSLARIKDTVEDLQMALAEALFPAIKNVADEMREWLSEPAVKDGIRNLGKDIAGLFSRENIREGVDTIKGFFKGLSELPWGAIKAGISGAAEAAGRVVSIFKSLPPGVQTALLTLLAANKLTGGLVATGIGELLKVGLRSLTSIFAGNVTVIGKSVITPGGLPGAVPGGAAAAGGLGAAATAGIIGVGVVGGIVVKGLDQQATGDLANAIAATDLSVVDRTTAQQLGPFFEHLGNGLRILGFDFGTQTAALGGQLQNVAQGTYQTAANTAGLLKPGDLDSQLGNIRGGIAGLGAQLGPQLGSLTGAVNAGFVTIGGRLGGIAGGIAGVGAGIGALNAKTGTVAGGIANANARLGVIANKDFSPNVTTNVTVRSTFSVSARAVARATESWTIAGRPRVV